MRHPQTFNWFAPTIDAKVASCKQPVTHRSVYRSDVYTNPYVYAIQDCVLYTNANTYAELYRNV